MGVAGYFSADVGSTLGDVDRKNALMALAGLALLVFVAYQASTAGFTALQKLGMAGIYNCGVVGGAGAKQHCQTVYGALQVMEKEKAPLADCMHHFNVGTPEIRRCD